MRDPDAWLRARFALMTDPWEAAIGAYDILISMHGFSEQQALEKICKEMGPPGPEVCNEKVQEVER